MTSNTTNRANSSFRDLLRGALIGAEGSRGVGFPASGTSGVSVTPFQIDLAGNPKVRGPFIDAAINSGAIKDRAEAERLFSIRYDNERMGQGGVDRAQFVRDQRAAIALAEKAMESPEVRAVTDRAIERHIDKVAEATERVCSRAAPQAQAFCNSTQGRLEIAAYIHQGNPDDTKKIEAYFRGQTVTLGDGKGGQRRDVRIEGNLDSEQFRNNYQGSTLWGQTNRPGLNTRHQGLDGFLRQQNLDDGSRARINPGQRSDAGSDDTQSQTAHAQDTEDTRERSANIASSFAQPDASRVTWRPDPAMLQDAIASVGAQDLPGWAQNLLGRDVMSNGAKKAVMGFQTAINDATRPMPYDYRWSFDKRNGRIDVDGDLGPQTRGGFGRAVDKHGEDGFAKRYATNQFGRYVKAVDQGRATYDELEDTVAGTLGQAQQDAAARLQASLNKLHDDREEPGERLKIDGWIGPKTTEDFRTTLYRVGSDRLQERFDRDDFWGDEDRA